MVEKTIYESFGKVVLENECTGIMISAEHYQELSALGLTDETMFEAMRY